MKYNWAIIGCGHIANEMAQAMADMGGTFCSVYSRTYDNAVRFASRYNIPRVCSSVDEIINDDSIDIVYIATPHNSHIDYLRQLLSAGKHVLCEKAITLNSAELKEAMDIAAEKNLVLAEAMTIFHCPVYRQLDGILSQGKLGPLKTIMVDLGSYKEYDMTNRFFSLDLAGGAMLDIGVYALSFARYFMSQCPNDILSQMKKAPTGADEQVNIILKNENNEMATVNLSLTAKLPKLGIASFENGYIVVDNYNRTRRIDIVYTADEHTETLVDDSDLNALAYEVMHMEDAVSGGPNTMHLDYTADVMDMMTSVRYHHDMRYPEEL